MESFEELHKSYKPSSEKNVQAKNIAQNFKESIIL